MKITSFSERRHSPRHSRLGRGRIILENPEIEVDCFIKDISAGGIRIELFQNAPAMNATRLYIEDADLSLSIDPVWQVERDLGLAFREPPPEVLLSGHLSGGET